MIGKIQGIIDSVYSDFAIIMTSSGVGYKIFFNSRTLSNAKKGDSAGFFIETHVREDHIHLYGFENEEEQIWFNLLTSVQGVGAKAGMSILSILTPSELFNAISSQDKAMIGRANGIGPKVSSRIILELEKKISSIPTSMSVDNFSLKSDFDSEKTTANDKIIAREDAISALANLGYNRTQAYTIVSDLMKENTEISTSDLIRKALKNMDKK